MKELPVHFCMACNCTNNTSISKELILAFQRQQMHLISHSNAKLQNNIICFSTNRDLQSVSIPAAPMKEKHSAPALLSSAFQHELHHASVHNWCTALIQTHRKQNIQQKKTNRKSRAKKLAKQTETMFLMMEARYKCCLNPVRPSRNYNMWESLKQ